MKTGQENKLRTEMEEQNSLLIGQNREGRYRRARKINLSIVIEEEVTFPKVFTHLFLDLNSVCSV